MCAHICMCTFRTYYIHISAIQMYIQYMCAHICMCTFRTYYIHISTIQMYIQDMYTHTQHKISGVFLMPTDSLDDAYKSLRTLVMEYAGITPNSLVQSTDSIPPSALQRRWVSQGDHDGETDNTPSAQFFSEEEEEDSPETGTTSYTQQSGRSSGTESKNDPDTSTADTSTVLRTAGSMPDTSTGNTSTVIQSTMNSRAGNRPHTSADLPPAENNTKLFTQYEKSTHVGHSPSKFKNIQNVSKSWSRPSTSMSGRSTQSYSKRQTRSEVSGYARCEVSGCVESEAAGVLGVR